MSQRSQYADQVCEGLRPPLARIVLAASELERVTETPRALSLCQRIASGAEELDRVVGQLRALLRPSEVAHSLDAEDLRAPVLALHERLAPVLEARGQSCPPPDLPDHPVRGRSLGVRHAAIALLQAAAACPGSRALRLSLIDESLRYGVRVDLHSRQMTDSAPRGVEAERLDGWQALRERLHGLVLARGGALEIEAVEGGASLAVWWERRDVCSPALPGATSGTAS